MSGESASARLVETMTDPSLEPRRCLGVAAHVKLSNHGSDPVTVDHWRMGDGTWLMCGRYETFAVSARRDHRADPASRLITIAVIATGDWTLTRTGAHAPPPPGEPALIAVDQSRAFDFRAHGGGSAVAVHLTQSRLTLSIETIRRGLDHLDPRLPLYPLVRDHLEQLGTVATTAERLLPELETSTVALIRSLLLNAADSAPAVDQPAAVVAAIERYIACHLDDPGLHANAIAGAHNISTRQLYKIWPHSPLADYIIVRRLERARTTLITHPHLTIAAIGRRHGFTDPTHFTHRFRATFGVAPSHWRRAQNSVTAHRAGP
ncbi:helix-turn-helix domain-containing protein [Nocardia alba]|uniref:AraC-like DNA-binding protein n=1 Tax=Nocardia alba TaxID=225051 RepID=A0A4R1G9T8_9NOCA|nr:helix-turn-helix domain-containing protein [Nocardia alba]TCK00922.1 AraC-like DNA-binding protein [Nocardia alba]